MNLLIKRRIICAILLFVSYCASQNITSKGYEVFPTGTYKFHKERVTWGEAWCICRSEGAHLAIINSDTEVVIMAGIFARVKESYSPYCHLGFHDKFIEGLYVTIDNESLLQDTGYMKWEAGEPNNIYGGEDCGSMSHGGLLNDIQCTSSMVFICEK